MPISKSLKIIGVALGSSIGLAVLVAIALTHFLDVDTYKARIERMASDLLAMQVGVDGRTRIGFLPSLQVTLEDVHIRNRETEVANAREARIGIAALPLLQGELRVKAIMLEQPSISIERGEDGGYNFERSGEIQKPLTALILPKVAISGGTIRYVDQRSGEGFEADDCSLNASHLRRSIGGPAGILRNLAFAAELSCGQVRTRSYVASDLKVSVAARDGVFDLEPVTFTIFGGQGRASIKADFTGTTPIYDVSYTLAQFRIEEFLKNLSTRNAAEGSMDFSANLAMHGATMHDLTQSMHGQMMLRGTNLMLNGYDLDQAFAQYESSQAFNLVDLGALFFAGPVGLTVSKGYNFASILQGTEGRSAIRILVSDWSVEQGVAQSLDVAIATDANRVALQGALDFVNERFDNVTVALLDERGCIRAQQTIHGSFAKPVVDKPSTMKALTGPVANLLKRLGRRFQDEHCDVFYAGSIGSSK